MNMKLDYRQIRICIGVVLTIILMGQVLWIYNMYRAYKEQWTIVVGQVVEKAILREGQDRYHQMGGTIVYEPARNLLDTVRYITKTVTAIDSTFQVTFDMHDHYWEDKFRQFLLIQQDKPVNVQNLNLLFRQELTAHEFPLAGTAVEYIDMAEGTVVASTAAPIKSGISTDIIPIDTYATRGVRLSAELLLSRMPIHMMIQLFLSAILIGICIFFLYTVIRTFLWRDKVEELRQSSVNAMLHEFKRPISAAVAQAALIPYYVDKGDAPRVCRYGEGVLLELNKLTAYTERVHKLSNNDKERIVLKKECIDLRTFFGSLIERYADADEKPVDIILSMETEQEYIYADLIHFSNMMENLIENSIKYSRDTASICIRVMDADDRLCISVGDNGLGISQSDMAYIFDRFFRSEAPQVQKRVGFGLGLTYVKALAEAHGAAIKVVSKFGEGTEFSLYFPVDYVTQQSIIDRG